MYNVCVPESTFSFEIAKIKIGGAVFKIRRMLQQEYIHAYFTNIDHGFRHGFKPGPVPEKKDLSWDQLLVKQLSGLQVSLAEEELLVVALSGLCIEVLSFEQVVEVAAIPVV